MYCVVLKAIAKRACRCKGRLFHIYVWPNHWIWTNLCF